MGHASSAQPVFGSATAVLELAVSGRWRAPETTAALAGHAAAQARAESDTSCALLAEGWLIHGVAAVGRGPAAVARAVAALGEAARSGHRPAEARLRVGLAAVARELGDADSARALLDPVLSCDPDDSDLATDAYLEAVRCGGPDLLTVSGLAADHIRRLRGEQVELGLASLDAALANRYRVDGNPQAAAARAREGLRRLLGDALAGSDLDPISPHIAAWLSLELTLALLDDGRADAARRVAEPALAWSGRPAALVPLTRLRLALAQRAYLPMGENEAALRAVAWAAGVVGEQDLPGLEADCQSLLAEVHEQRGALPDALTAIRRAHQALRVHSVRVEQALVLLGRSAGGAPAGPAPADRPGNAGHDPGPTDGRPPARTSVDQAPSSTAASFATGPTVRLPMVVRRPAGESIPDGPSGHRPEPAVRPGDVAGARPLPNRAPDPVPDPAPNPASNPASNPVRDDAISGRLERNAGPVESPGTWPAPISPNGTRSAVSRSDDGWSELTGWPEEVRTESGFAGGWPEAGPAESFGAAGEVADHYDAGRSAAGDRFGLDDPEAAGWAEAGSWAEPGGRSGAPGVAAPVADRASRYPEGGPGPGTPGREPEYGSMPKFEEVGLPPDDLDQPINGDGPQAEDLDPIAQADPPGPGGDRELDELFEPGEDRPLGLVALDVATPTGPLTRDAVRPLLEQIAEHVRGQLPPNSRLGVLARDAVLVVLPPVEPEVVARWMRSLAGGLSARWSEYAAETPRSAFRIAVGALEPGRPPAETVTDLCERLSRQSAPGARSASGGRHVARARAAVEMNAGARPSDSRAGGRRRRPDDGTGPASVAAASGSLSVPTADDSSRPSAHEPGADASGRSRAPGSGAAGSARAGSTDTGAARSARASSTEEGIDGPARAGSAVPEGTGPNRSDGVNPSPSGTGHVPSTAPDGGAPGAAGDPVGSGSDGAATGDPVGSGSDGVASGHRSGSVHPMHGASNGSAPAPDGVGGGPGLGGSPWSADIAPGFSANAGARPDGNAWGLGAVPPPPAVHDFALGGLGGTAGWSPVPRREAGRDVAPAGANGPGPGAGTTSASESTAGRSGPASRLNGATSRTAGLDRSAVARLSRLALHPPKASAPAAPDLAAMPAADSRGRVEVPPHAAATERIVLAAALATALSARAGQGTDTPSPAGSQSAPTTTPAGPVEGSPATGMREAGIADIRESDGQAGGPVGAPSVAAAPGVSASSAAPDVPAPHLLAPGGDQPAPGPADLGSPDSGEPGSSGHDGLEPNGSTPGSRPPASTPEAAPGAGASGRTTDPVRIHAPTAELSFAELLAGALAAYRDG